MWWTKKAKGRVGVHVAMAVGLLAVLGCAGGGSRGASERPPVLLITVDGLVAPDLAPFGGARPMPQLQRLVDQGMAWPAALSAVPMTRPAVATYLTGVAPDRHGVRDDLFAILPAEIPTLAERLTAAGYHTAGFPDSSFLPERSGLWRGFDIVDRPPPVAISASRWLPRVRPANLTGEAFSAWLDSLEPGVSWFGWIHLSQPLVGQFKEQYFSTAAPPPAGPAAGAGAGGEPPRVVDVEGAPPYEEILGEFDHLLGEILARVDARPEGPDTLVLLAGTLADQRRDESPFLPGPGYSLAARAVEVPLVVRFPRGVEPARGAEQEVWAPDLAATVAAVAGVEPAPQAEGVSLTAPLPERTVFSWSWALLDQLGWRPLALARAGGRELLVGSPAGAAALEEAGLEDLRQALEGRANPPRAGLPQDLVAPFLSEFDVRTITWRGEEVTLELEPLPADGRDFGDPELRKSIATRIWEARGKFQSNQIAPGNETLAGVAEEDELNYAAHLDRGQMMALNAVLTSKRVLKKAVLMRPDDPEVWHWFAHALWLRSWEDAEKIITAIQPYLGNQADALYDLACTRSLAGDLEVSADYLERAYLAGFRDRSHINADSDLRNLRESDHFSEVMQRFH